MVAVDISLTKHRERGGIHVLVRIIRGTIFVISVAGVVGVDYKPL